MPEKVTKTDRSLKDDTDQDPMEAEIPYGRPSGGNGGNSLVSGSIFDHGGSIQTTPVDPNIVQSSILMGVLEDDPESTAGEVELLDDAFILEPHKLPTSAWESRSRTTNDGIGRFPKGTKRKPSLGASPATSSGVSLAEERCESEDEEESALTGVIELRDVVREARTTMIHQSDGTLSFLEGFDDVVGMIASSATNFDDEKDVVGEEDEAILVSAFEKKVIADRRLHRRMMSRDGRQTFDKALFSEEATRAKKRGKVSIPASHPIQQILPYIPHLHAVFWKMSNQLAWLTDSKSSIEQKAIASRFVQLLEYMSDQVSSILTLHDDNPSLFNDVSSISGIESSSDAIAFDNLFLGEMNDDVCERTTANSGNAYAAITFFRLVLSVLADGSSLVEKAHAETIQKETIERDLNYSRLMSFHNEMEEMVKLDGGIGLDGNAMNQRGALAAMKLGKLKVTHGRNASADKRKSADFSETSLDVLKDLLEWMANADIVLTDLTGLTSTTVMRYRASGDYGRHDGVDYLLRTTIPEILSVGSLDATENITAIVAAFIRKRRKIMEIIPVREVEDDAEETAEVDEAEIHSLYKTFLLKAEEFVADSKLLRYLPRSRRGKLAVFLSGSMWVLHYTYAYSSTLGMAFATLMAIVLTRRFIVKRLDSPRPEASAHANDFLPQLPERCIPRKELQRRAINTILNSKDLMVEDATSAISDNDTTIMTGSPGIGKTTIANMVVRDPAIRDRFPDGVVWLSFDLSPRLTYETLIQMYDQISKQLAVVSHSRAVATHASSYDAQQYYLQPEDEGDDKVQLMNDLREDFLARVQVATKSVLVVVDGLQDLRDVEWFRRKDQSGKGAARVSKQHSGRGRGHILVTTTTAAVQHGKDFNYLPHWSRTVEIGLLADDEANVLLENESKTSGEGINLDMSVARGRDWAYSPLTLKCLGRIASSRYIVYGQREIGVDTRQSSTSLLMNRLAALSKSTTCSNEEERSLGIVKESLDYLFSNMGGVGDVMRLCFCAFVALFFDQSTAAGCLLMEPYIPANIATIFWDGLLNSEEILVEDLMDLERCLVPPQDKNGGALISRSSFVADRLVALGLLKAIPRGCGKGKTKIKGYTVEHAVLGKIGLLLEGTDLWKNEDMDSNKQAWSVTLVHGYQEYLSGIGTRRDRSSKEGEEDQHFIMRYIVKHMLLGGMGDKALELWSNESFFQNRMRRLGSLNATMQHIADANCLLDMLQDEGEITTLSGRSVYMSSAKIAIIASFERIANHLAQFPGDYIEDFVKASASLFLLGQSLLKQRWNNEAFVIFQESVGLCHVVLTYNRKSHAAVYRILARALQHIGVIHAEKGDVVESIKSFSEALHYSSIAPSGYNSIQLDTMRTLCCLGDAHLQNGDVAAALKAHNRLLIAVGATFGREHLRYADALQRIGMIHVRNGDANKARELFSDALRVRRILLAAVSPEIATSLHCLGISHRDLGNENMALEMLKEAISVWEEVIAADSGPMNQVNYASTLHDLGLLHRQRGELDDALRTYTEALRLRQGILGEEHEETAQTLQNIGIAYCDKGAHEEAMKAFARSLQLQKKTALSPSQSPKSQQAQQDLTHDEGMKSFTNALWASQALRTDAPTVKAIKERTTCLFGEEIEKLPCTSARIFACSSLMVDRMIKSESPDARSGIFGKSDSSVMEWITSMLPFMIAAVHAEMSVGFETWGDEEDVKAANSPRKLVSFCSFDFSAVTSPIDMAVGSNAPLERSIEALEKVIKEIHRLKHSESSANQKGTGEKAKLLLVLYAMTTPIEGKAMREACAQAMPYYNEKPWPPSRFLHAAELYRTELESLIASDEDESEEENAVVSSPSPLRERLSTQIGSATRFHLRRLFDPLPMYFTMPSDKYKPPDLSDCRARTYEVVALSPPAGVETNDASDGSDGPAPLWDRPISHVFNLALQRTHAYFQIVDEVRQSLTVKGDPSKGSASLTLSQASKRCLEGRSKDKSVSEVDVDDILRDVHMAHACLSATRASKFILSLLRWPGLAEAVEEAGGWQPIESLARTLKRFHLDRDFPDEAHFAQLENVNDLIALLEANRSEMMTAARASQKVLQDMWKRFKRGAGRRKRRHTYDSVVRQVLLDDSTTAVFPILTAPG